MNSIKQQFETEFKKQSPKSRSDIFKVDETTGDYFYLLPRTAWRYWKLSRESLEIELPKGCNPSIVGDIKQEKYLIGINDGIERCRFKLTEQGVKIR